MYALAAAMTGPIYRPHHPAKKKHLQKIIPFVGLEKEKWSTSSERKSPLHPTPSSLTLITTRGPTHRDRQLYDATAIYFTVTTAARCLHSGSPLPRRASSSSQLLPPDPSPSLASLAVRPSPALPFGDAPGLTTTTSAAPRSVGAFTRPNMPRY